MIEQDAPAMLVAGVPFRSPNLCAIQNLAYRGKTTRSLKLTDLGIDFTLTIRRHPTVDNVIATLPRQQVVPWTVYAIDLTSS